MAKDSKQINTAIIFQLHTELNIALQSNLVFW